ncbi:MAG: hypothetical protein LBV04_08575 [Deferribacteraceae bacterium]|jgi:hypothetical protein|nr:hypothetical protein [Deferribacteraceae bacterium]
MRVTIISGSPRSEKGATELIANNLMMLLRGKAEASKIVAMNYVGRYDNVLADVLVLVFPLRSGAVPTHVMQLMADMEIYCKKGNVGPVVYVIANSSLYEAARCKNAIAIVRNWALRNGASWGGAIGLGGCHVLNSSDKVPSTCLKALVPFAKRIAAVKSKYSFETHKRDTKDIFINPSIPRFLYSLTTRNRWKQRASKNKVELGRAY